MRSGLQAEEEQSSAGLDVLQAADVVAKDKGLEREEIFRMMEESVQRVAQIKYGKEKDIIASIDRKTGKISIFRRMTVVESVSDPAREIEHDGKVGANIGDVIDERLPDIDFARMSAQPARQVLRQKIRFAERERQYEEFSGRVGEIISGTVKRIEFSNIIIDIGQTEGVIRRSETIPNEIIKVGDRIRVLLASLNKDSAGPLLQLSRTSPEFLKKLFEQEVPEIYDGAISIVAVARDPGSKAKVAVRTSDQTLDPIGACVGVRGSRVQAVVDELKGEKMDIIQWSNNIAEFVVNSLSPAEVTRIVIDESSGKVEAIIPDERLSAAIGRRGQNVRLASRLTGWHINVIAESEDAKSRAAEEESIIKVFTDGLDVDEMVARLLINDGFTSIEELAVATPAQIASIDGFGDEMAEELKRRASDHVEQKRMNVEALCKELGVEEGLQKYELLTPELLETLVKSDIKTLNDLSDLSTDELLDVAGDLLSKKEAEVLIMQTRERYGCLRNQDAQGE